MKPLQKFLLHSIWPCQLHGEFHKYYWLTHSLAWLLAEKCLFACLILKWGVRGFVYFKEQNSEVRLVN